MREHVLGFLTLVAIAAAAVLLAILAALAFTFLAGFAAGQAGLLGAPLWLWIRTRRALTDRTLHREADRGVISLERERAERGWS